MTRYRFFISYDGTRYCGWQVQPEDPTVQGVLEQALGQILRREVTLVGQGRTDSGVHAEGQVAHADLPEDTDPQKLLYALPGVLPRDIAVWHMEQADPAFHARFDARSRTYRYQILRRPAPLLQRQAILVRGALDLEAMRQCADYILGEHDFESFTTTGRDQSHARCTVLRSGLTSDEQMITWRIQANRFVRHMVRRLAGTMIQVGQGKRTVEEFRELVDRPRSDSGAHGAKAQGLILEDVEY